MSLPVGVTTRIVLVRHGETVESARGRCYGKLDVGLSEHGKQQIEQAAEFVKEFDPTAIYASPRTRATDSASVIARRCNLFFTINESFAELDFGDFEGLTYETVERRFPEIYRQWMSAPTTVEFPNGESFAGMQRRVLEAVETLKEQHWGETFVIVAHGGTARIVLADALGMANANLFRLEQSYAGVSVIDFYNDFPVVRAMNAPGSADILSAR